jgi:heat shock protein HslJ
MYSKEKLLIFCHLIGFLLLWGQVNATSVVENNEWRLMTPKSPVGSADLGDHVASFILDGKNHRVHGNSGCNSFVGAYKLSGVNLRFTQVASTRKFCSGQLGEQETEFLKMLDATERWEIEAGNLVLLSGRGQALGQFTLSKVGH